MIIRFDNNKDAKKFANAAKRSNVLVNKISPNEFEIKPGNERKVFLTMREIPKHICYSK